MKPLQARHLTEGWKYWPVIVSHYTSLLSFLNSNLSKRSISKKTLCFPAKRFLFYMSQISITLLKMKSRDMKFFRYRIGLFFCACIIAITCSAQQAVIRTHTLKDGLVMNRVRGFFQDSDGFIWIYTWDGL